jgi:hypothetical protein
MRTTITLPDETHEFALYYANARGLSLGAAIDELIRKAQTAPARPESEIVFAADGFPMFPPSDGIITSEMVKKLEEEEFDPEKLA